MTFATSWWFSRKVRIRLPAMTFSQVGRETAALLKLGFAFMVSGFLTMGAAYTVRTMVLRTLGLEAAGYYQAAWTLGGLYVGFILQAMSADFYPRLTGVARDHATTNRIVNEQALISLLLAGPGVIATLTFTPMVIAIFYSAKFTVATEVLRWICLGMALRVLTWPMGFIILAQGASSVFFWTEVAWTVVNVGLSWLCLRYFGLNGAGIAFFGSYAFHALMIYPIVRRMSGFRWTAVNRRAGLIFFGMIAAVLGGYSVLPSLPATGLGAAIMILSGVYSLHALLNLVSPERIPRPLARLLARLGFERVGPRA